MTTNTSKNDYGTEPWDILRAAGYEEEADQVKKQKLSDRGGHQRKEDECAGGACSIVTDPDGSPDHPEVNNE